MKPLKILISLFILSMNFLQAQSITGKWYNSSYNQEVHFQEDGLLALAAEGQISYGCFQLDGDQLYIAFFDENETKAVYTWAFNSRRELSLKIEETGDSYYFKRTGDAEIPEELVQQFLESVGEDWQKPVQAVNTSAQKPTAPKQAPVQSHASAQASVAANSDPHGADLPGENPPAGTRGRTGIVGKWQTVGTALDPEILTLTADGYFMITTIPSMPDLFPATYGYGKYSYENGSLLLKFFNYFELYEKEVNMLVANLNARGFDKPYDFYGETQYIHYAYQGTPDLPTEHRTAILAYLTFNRMLGQWRSKENVIKFMGEGDMILELNDGQFFMSEYSVNYDGKTAQFKMIDAAEGDYYYTGEILTFTPNKLVMRSTKNGEIETFVYEGKPQLNREQYIVYAKLRQVKHQGAMMTIDAMDGIRDWIWVDRKY